MLKHFSIQVNGNCFFTLPHLPYKGFIGPLLSGDLQYIFPKKVYSMPWWISKIKAIFISAFGSVFLHVPSICLESTNLSNQIKSHHPQKAAWGCSVESSYQTNTKRASYTTTFCRYWSNSPADHHQFLSKVRVPWGQACSSPRPSFMAFSTAGAQ